MNIPHRQNSKIYGVSHKIECVVADAYELLSVQKYKFYTVVDLILLAPPWGGVSYTNNRKYNLSTMISSGDGIELLLQALEVCPNVIYILPKNTPKKTFDKICKAKQIDCLVEDMFLWDKLKMSIAYFGPMIASRS